MGINNWSNSVIRAPDFDVIYLFPKYKSNIVQQFVGKKDGIPEFVSELETSICKLISSLQGKVRVTLRTLSTT